MNIITKIIDSLKGVYAMTENNEETNTEKNILDKELEDIGYSVDVNIEGAEKHIEEGINAGKTESVLLSLKSHVSVEKDPVPSIVHPNIPSNVPQCAFQYFQALLERILITINNCGSLQDQSLNLSAKEKLTERDVQTYKYWLIDYAREDCFESLVDWVELRVQVIGKAREETEGFGKQNEERGNKNRDERQRFPGFNTRFSTTHCIVNTCKQDHPPWVCDAFKRLPVQKRKELISKSSRYYRCLAAGHHSKDCRKARKCGVDGCQSNNHSSYFHESTPQNGNTNARQQLEPEAPTFYPRHPPAQEARTEQFGRMDINNQQRAESSTQERTHKTRPSFLKDGESPWPTTAPSKDVQKSDQCERRSTTTYATRNYEFTSIDPTHFSSLKRLYRVTGWINLIRRFIANYKLRFVGNLDENMKKRFLLLRSLMLRRFGSNTRKQKLS
ncbi:Hypothetical predicted protein [Paramuricea clavata]|uniref:Uncharacterized protein n=2 Tax=Paramuricea clavata TaxID=317549 RepID=A0A6S7FUA8_PARCT|nr:Hypothetical predicted protein [Paramuricea clavata]